MSKSSIIVGIDVGTYKVCTVVAEAGAGPNSPLNVLGVGAVASEGLAKGMITDIVKASGAIAHSLEAAERQSGCHILSAYVSTSGNHIASSNSRGLVAVSHPDRVISQNDVERAIEAARAMSPPPAGRDVLHVIPRTYTIDGQDGIRNPVGLSGFRLDVETHIVTGNSNVRENLIRCVQKADVEVDDLVLSPLASAEAVLTEQEKNLGVVLVDIGHGTTDIAIYVEGAVWHTKIIPVGGWHLTNDLVIVFGIPYEAAESLKLQYGQAVVPGSVKQPRPAEPARNGKSHAHASSSVSSSVGLTDYPQHEVLERSPIEDEEMLETETFEGTPRHISRDDLNEVMAARLEQLFGLVGDEIRRSGYEGLLPAGVVLTGGVAAMRGIEPLASHKLHMPIRIGRPHRVGGLADSFEVPSYATAVGLLQWGSKQSAAISQTRVTQRSRGDKEQSEGTLAKWLRRFLPQG